MYSTYHSKITIKIERSQRFFEKKIVEFYENPSSGSRVVACGRTDMTKLIDAFGGVANAPRNSFEFIADRRPGAN
jgi:hypothetical protein